MYWAYFVNASPVLKSQVHKLLLTEKVIAVN